MISGIFPTFAIVFLQLYASLAVSGEALLQLNQFQKHFLGLHIPIFLQSGLGTWSTVEVNSDTLRVRTKPEVRLGGSEGLYMTLEVV